MGSRHTLVHRLADWAERTPTQPAIHERAGVAWRTLTWAEYWTAVRETAKGLIALGHEVGDCVALVGNSRVDWVICQFGIMAARGIPAPIYTNNTVAQASYIVNHAKAKIAIADDAERLANYRGGKEQGLHEAAQYVVMDETEAGDDVRSLAALRKLGRAQDDAELDKRLSEMAEDETGLLIYTSGTTGVPKAVQLEHGGMVQITEGLLDRVPKLREPGAFKVISYLPLCHVAEQFATNFAQMGTGGEAFFCPSITDIKDYLTAVRPTVFLGVPRVWEKFQAALEAKLSDATGIKGMLAKWARKTELAAIQKQAETGVEVQSFSRKLANKLVISKVQTALGLDRLIFAVTGAAPISKGTLHFFASLGITIYEVYGMSETYGIATGPTYGRPAFGTVGTAAPGVEIKIAEDDEILLRGRTMTRSYLHMPEQTAELLDADGWLHTGDLGALDGQDRLRITGRKKDLLITAGGKNVAPAEMEAHISQIPGVGQVIVVGDRQPYLSALVTLDPEALDSLCEAVGVESAPVAELAANAKVASWLMARVEADCNSLVARYQTIKKIRVLPIEFTVDGGEMTPTMKVKRNVIVKRYADDIDALYIG